MVELPLELGRWTETGAMARDSQGKYQQIKVIILFSYILS